MKIRTGFVSNSSSTSFTAIWPEEVDNLIIKQLNEFEMMVFGESNLTKQEMCGKEYSIYQSYYGNLGEWEIEWLKFAMRTDSERKEEIENILKKSDLSVEDWTSEFWEAKQKIDGIFSGLKENKMCITQTADF